MESFAGVAQGSGKLMYKDFGLARCPCRRWSADLRVAVRVPLLRLAWNSEERREPDTAMSALRKSGRTPVRWVEIGGRGAERIAIDDVERRVRSIDVSPPCSDFFGVGLGNPFVQSVRGGVSIHQLG